MCAWGGGDKANGQTKNPSMVLVNFHSSRIARFVKIPWLVHRQQSKEGKEGSLSAVIGCSAQEMRTDWKSIIYGKIPLPVLFRPITSLRQRILLGYMVHQSVW